MVGIHLAHFGKRQTQPVSFKPLRRRIGRIAQHANKNTGADGVNIRPRPQISFAPIHLGRSKAGRVHRAQKIDLVVDNFTRRAKIDQYRPVVVGDENIGWFDIKMQHAMLMHHPQAGENFIEQGINGCLVKDALFFS